MTETEKAYIAGIIDGKGSIMLQILNKGKNPSPCVSIDSTHKELLEYLKNVLKYGRIISKKNYNPEICKDCYSFLVTYNNAIDLLKETYPYLLNPVKKQKAYLIFNKYKSITPRNGKYNEEMLRLKDEFYEEFMALK